MFIIITKCKTSYFTDTITTIRNVCEDQTTAQFWFAYWEKLHKCDPYSGKPEIISMKLEKTISLGFKNEKI